MYKITKCWSFDPAMSSYPTPAPPVNTAGEVVAGRTEHRQRNLRHIQTEINEIYRAIVRRMTDARRDGASEIIYQLPSTFAVPNMKPVEIQLTVYGSLIERLRNENVNVKIRFQGKAASLRIAIPPPLTPSELRRLKQIIIDNMDK